MIPSHVSCTIKLIVDFPITPELQVSKTPPCCQITKCHCQSFIYIDTFLHNSISFSYVGSHHFKKLIATLFIHVEIIMKVFHLLFFFFHLRGLCVRFTFCNTIFDPPSTVTFSLWRLGQYSCNACFSMVSHNAREELSTTFHCRPRELLTLHVSTW